MTASLKLMIFVRDAFSGQGSIEEHRVVIIHDGVVLAIDQKDRWTVVGYVAFERERVAQSFVSRSVVAK